MGSFRLIGFFSVVPVTILLMLSFFVMAVALKNEMRQIKTFGMVVCALLWISALVILSAGAYTAITGRHPMFNMMRSCWSAMNQRAPGGADMDMPVPVPGK